MSTERDFERKFKSYYTPLGMYVLRMCGNVADTEDIVQEAFSAVWQKCREGQLPDNFRSYLYRTAHNITIDRIRKSSLTDSEVRLDDLNDIEPTEETIDTSERDARLWQAIAKLPERCREVFLLSKRDGLSHSQIAQQLGISIKTVENQMTKAFKSLRESLEPDKGIVFFLPFL